LPSIQDLQPLVTEPREDLASEYKTWLDLNDNEHKAIVAKAAIALVNHGGGFITIGFDDTTGGLTSCERPIAVPEITQDAVNAAIRRFASPEFHCELYSVSHPRTGVVHPVVSVPGTLTVPVMSKRDCEGTIIKNRCYIRKPGPRSEEPQTGEEWRSLLNRCVRAGRDDMLEAIRAIVTGRIEPQQLRPDIVESLQLYCNEAHSRWRNLVGILPEHAPARMINGFYDIGFAFSGGQPASSLVELQNRLQQARNIRLTGWTPFLDMGRPEWASYPYDGFVEAWVGRPVENRMMEEAAYSDFWRASVDGNLYTVRGYKEDSLEGRPVAQFFDVTLPIWRVAEGLLFARRLAETFENVEAITTRCRFTGLAGRHLVSVDGTRNMSSGRVCRTDEVLLTSQASLQQIDDNLVETIHQLLIPLYEQFDFFPLSTVIVEQEIGKLTRGQF
jgi:hypothetical protein